MSRKLLCCFIVILAVLLVVICMFAGALDVGRKSEAEKWVAAAEEKFALLRSKANFSSAAATHFSASLLRPTSKAPANMQITTSKTARITMKQQSNLRLMRVRLSWAAS